MPQALVLHEAAELAPNESEPAPETFEAKVDIFLEILWLPQAGHFTPPIALALRTNSSNGLLHSVHTNSNNGMYFSSRVRTTESISFLDARLPQRLQSG
jgi:hypothetical protein